MRYSLCLIGIACLALTESSGSSYASEQDRTRDGQKIDKATLTRKEQSAQILLNSFNANRNSPQAPAVLAAYCEILDEIITIQNRISYATGAPSSEFKTSLTQLIKQLTLIITQFRNYEEIGRVYYLRGRAYLKNNQKEAAIADLEHLVGSWPNSPEALPGSLSLWDLLMDKKDYRRVVEHIKQINISSDSKFYPMALERLEWAHFFLNEPFLALQIAEKLLNYSKDQDPQERRTSVINLAVFYTNSSINKTPKLQPRDALIYFRSHLNEAELEIALLRYALLLRTKGMSEELEKVQGLLENEKTSDGFRCDLLIMTLENQMNTRRFIQVKSTAAALMQLENSPKLKGDDKRITRLKSTLAETTVKLQKVFLEQKRSTSVSNAIAESLISLYHYNVTQREDDESKSKINFNLGELYLLKQDYESAVTAFKWVIEKTSPNKKSFSNKKDQADFFKKSSLRLIEVTYLKFKNLKLIPNMLNPISLTSPQRDLPSEIIQWMSWVDDYVRSAPFNETIDGLYFDTIRTLYSYGHTVKAIERIFDFLKAYPSSAFASASLSLVLDTYVLSEEWQKIFDLVSIQVDHTQWKKSPELQKRLIALQSDSYYKLLEAGYRKGEFQNTLVNGDRFLHLHPTSQRRAEFFELLGNAALKLGNKKLGLKYFTQLRSTGSRKPENQLIAASTAESLAEESYQYDEATSQYLKYLATTAASQTADPKELNAIRSKTLLFAWLSGDVNLLKKVFESTLVCPSQESALALECEKSKARIACSQAPSNSNFMKLEKEAKTGGKLGVIYATGALANPKLSTDRKLNLIKIIASNWEEQDALTQFSAIPIITNTALGILTQIRQGVRKFGVALDKNVIKKRVKLIETAEAQMDAIAGLPVIEIRLSALMATSGLFRDLATDISALRPPPGLAGGDLKVFRDTLDEIRSPFQKKAIAIEKQAFDIAGETGIDSKSIADRASNPTVPFFPISPKISQDLKLLLQVLIKSSDLKSSSEIQSLCQTFFSAIARRNWPMAAFMVQEAKRLSDQGKLSTEEFTLIKVLSLNAIGATPEALGALLAVQDRNPVIQFLVFAGFFNAQAKDKAKHALKDFTGKVDPAQAQWFLKAKAWASSDDDGKELQRER